jgi:uncharacterized protein (DUF302 family)
MATAISMGITSLSSGYNVKETMDKLETGFRSKGITIYGRIDQQAEAKKVELMLRPLELLIFGNPRAGVPLMQKEPLSALDLPLKLLAWEDADGKVWVSYNDPRYLQNRFGLPQELIDKLSIVETLIKNILDIQ